MEPKNNRINNVEILSMKVARIIRKDLLISNGIALPTYSPAFHGVIIPAPNPSINECQTFFTDKCSLLKTSDKITFHLIYCNHKLGITKTAEIERRIKLTFLRLIIILWKL
jgi:hypothetical protein